MSLSDCKKTITVLVPAFNEEKNLDAAVKNALNALNNNFIDYEIIILNANSSDNTGVIADKLASENDNIKVIHRKGWFGLGENYMEGVNNALMEYFVMFPGDNENSWVSLAESFKKIGKADIIVPYTFNTKVRAFHRRIISYCFVLFLNICFNSKLKYYNGNAVYKTKDLRKLKIISQDFAYNAEILIKLIRSGKSYTEIGININPTGKTAIFNSKNIFSIFRTLILLFWEVRIRNRKVYNCLGTCIES